MSTPIVLHFKKPVEVTINGKKYEGADVEVTDMKTAAEIVRLCKDAYGFSILK